MANGKTAIQEENASDWKKRKQENKEQAKKPQAVSKYLPKYSGGC